eukprot:gb/GEZN01005207.1/.p1 GENE.gb/GEZN01005207.1/~~gb/GEZN01005207.1/.p1  ORF type:complete len:467 (-),score=65.07 gb/GEZN01005207.1/:319-1719(-)
MFRVFGLGLFAPLASAQMDYNKAAPKWEMGHLTYPTKGESENKWVAATAKPDDFPYQQEWTGEANWEGMVLEDSQGDGSSSSTDESTSGSGHDNHLRHGTRMGPEPRPIFRTRPRRDNSQPVDVEWRSGYVLPNQEPLGANWQSGYVLPGQMGANWQSGYVLPGQDNQEYNQKPPFQPLWQEHQNSVMEQPYGVVGYVNHEEYQSGYEPRWQSDSWGSYEPHFGGDHHGDRSYEESWSGGPGGWDQQEKRGLYGSRFGSSGKGQFGGGWGRGYGGADAGRFGGPGGSAQKWRNQPKENPAWRHLVQENGPNGERHSFKTHGIAFDIDVQEIQGNVNIEINVDGEDQDVQGKKEKDPIPRLFNRHGSEGNQQVPPTQLPDKGSRGPQNGGQEQQVVKHPDTEIRTSASPATTSKPAFTTTKPASMGASSTVIPASWNQESASTSNGYNNRYSNNKPWLSAQGNSGRL